jgi:hypothetical protein
VRDAEHAVDRGWALFGLARYPDARAALAGIPPLDAPALTAATLALDAAIEARIGAAPHARVRLEEALQAAAAVNASDLELELWARLLRLELFASDDAHAVFDLAPFARMAAARAHRDGAEIEGIVGEALRNADRLDEARATLARALASRDPLRGDQRAVIEMNLGSVELAAGDPVAAEAAFVHAEAQARALLGAAHPELALYADKLASAERARGKLRAALAHHDASLAARERAFGPADRAVATSLFHRAETLREAGMRSRARADLQRAREIRVAAWGEHSARLAEIDALLADGADPHVTRRLAAWSGPELFERWRAAPAPVEAALSCAVGVALAAAGDRRAETVFTAGLAATTEEPSRTRLCLLEGLQRDTQALRAELAARDR